MKVCAILTNYLATIALIFASTTTQAKLSANEINRLNYNAVSEAFEASLREKFTTKEDHRQITYDFIKLKKLAERWIWRFEAQGDGLAFRLNGKVQFVVSNNPDARPGFLLNGKVFVLKEGESYASAVKRIERIFSDYNASLDSLFFKEAHAFLPILAFAAGALFFGGAALVGVARAQSAQCTVNYKKINGYVNSNGDSLKASPKVRRCHRANRPDWCSVPAARIGLVAKNYSKNCGSSGYNCRSFANVDDCVRVKTASEQKKGWGLTQTEATALCETAYNSLDCPTPNPPSPTPRPVTQQPVPQDPLGYVAPQTCPKNDRTNQTRLCASCSGNLDCCAKAGISCNQTSQPDPIGTLAPQTCPKNITQSEQLNRCQSCRGNLDCCTKAGITCGEYSDDANSVY